MEGRPLMGGPNQDNGPGGDHKGTPDVRRSSDEPETPDPELLALMRTGRDYLRLTEPKDDNNSGNRATGAESRSPPPPPHPPGPTPASTATHTPAGTPPTSIQGQKRSPGTLSLFPGIRPSPSVLAMQPLTEEKIDDYWSSGPTPDHPSPRSPAVSSNTKHEPESPNPTAPLSSGRTSTPITLPFRPTPPKPNAVEEQQGQQQPKPSSPFEKPKQEISTPASHKRNKSHGDHLNSAIHTRLPASPSPRPEPLSEVVSIPTPTRPPPRPPIEAPVISPGSTVNTDKDPTRVLSPDLRSRVPRPPGINSSPIPGPSNLGSRHAALPCTGILFRNTTTGQAVDWDFGTQVVEDVAGNLKEMDEEVDKTLIEEGLRSLRMEDHPETMQRESEEEGKGKGEEEGHRPD